MIKTWLLLTAYKMSLAPYPVVPSPIPTTYCLATIPHDRHRAYYSALWPSRSSKINAFYVIWKPICDFLL